VQKSSTAKTRKLSSIVQNRAFAGKVSGPFWKSQTKAAPAHLSQETGPVPKVQGPDFDANQISN
jgi:hypothetical protein